MQMIGQGYHLLGSKPWRIKSSNEHDERSVVQNVAQATLLMLSQNLREPPDVMERIIKRRRRGPDDVWFAEIAFHAGGLKFRERFLWMFVCEDRQLTTQIG